MLKTLEIYNYYKNLIEKKTKFEEIDLKKYINSKNIPCFESEAVSEVIAKELNRQRENLLDLLRQMNFKTMTWSCLYWKRLYNIDIITDEEFLSYPLEQQREIVELYSKVNGTFNEKHLIEVVELLYDEKFEITAFTNTEDNFKYIKISFLGAKGIPKNYYNLRKLLLKIKPIWIKDIIFEFNFTIWEEVKNNTWKDIAAETWTSIKVKE